MIRREHGINCMPCPSQIIREMLTEIQTMEKFDFLKTMIHLKKKYMLACNRTFPLGVFYLVLQIMSVSNG